jgi:hypothetical protein
LKIANIRGLLRKHRVPIVCDSDCVQSFGLLSNCCSKSLHLQRCWITSCNLIAHS